MVTEYSKEVIELAQAYGIQVTDHQASLLLKHIELLIEKNKVLNLTRIVEPHDAVVRHVLDSLLFLKGFDGISAEQSFLDIGTGGGFPGVALGVMTPLSGLLIDSVGKKVKAVEEFIEDLGLADRLEVSSMRAEELAVTSPWHFDYVVARAVAEQNVLIEYAAPLLRKGGRLVSSKANISDQEVFDAMRVAEICGLEILSRESIELPYQEGHRELFVFTKVHKPRIKLPRATGMAKHKPL